MIVFVHGVPESSAIWAKVRRAIGRDSIALSLPGFGCTRPAGFGATKDDYVRWLLGELDKIDGPIDLVGHDWGAGLTYRVASAHGERLRSWVADVANVIHPNYEWHSLAKLWQTTGEGEKFFEQQTALSPQERASGFEGMDVPPADALEMAMAMDVTMGNSILDLYRSATPNVYRHWGPWALTAAPGLVLHATADAFSNERLATEVAASLGARISFLDGVGHFWPYEARSWSLRIHQNLGPHPRRFSLAIDDFKRIVFTNSLAGRRE